jgi:hypothetical protein
MNIKERLLDYMVGRRVRRVCRKCIDLIERKQDHYAEELVARLFTDAKQAVCHA